MIDEMKSSCRLNKLVIKRDGVEAKISKETWERAETKFKLALSDDKATVANMDLGTISVSPDEILEMVLDYNMAKEFEDSEVFTTRLPVDSVTVTIVDKGHATRVVRARSIHTSELEDDTSNEANGTYCFKLMQWLLPQQGFVIWWKNVPERAPSQPSAGALEGG